MSNNCVFYHPLFLRGKQELAMRMYYTKVKRKTKRFTETATTKMMTKNNNGRYKSCNTSTDTRSKRQEPDLDHYPIVGHHSYNLMSTSTIVNNNDSQQTTSSSPTSVTTAAAIIPETIS